MRITTKPFGEIEVDERQEIFFPSGILGFEDLKHYVLLDATQPPFYWLQSVDVVDVSFVLIDPRVFKPTYRLEVNPEELDEIGVTAEQDIIDFSIVTIPDCPSEMTANLQGPIIVNRRTRVARQAISRNPDLSVRYRLVQTHSRVGEDAC